MGEKPEGPPLPGDNASGGKQSRGSEQEWEFSRRNEQSKRQAQKKRAKLLKPRKLGKRISAKNEMVRGRLSGQKRTGLSPNQDLLLAG